MDSVLLCKNNYLANNLNRRKAIHEKCLNCTGWIPSEVKNCSHKDCLLYSFRAGKGSQNTTARKKSIRNYCLDCMNEQVGEVSKCPSSNCPLFAYRKGDLEKRIKAPYLLKKSSSRDRFFNEISLLR